ncbi:MAG: hypothetical protein M8357_16820, partial [Desulfobulbaceae bacterium]|nr:hypothetical protein [Desulfobulbaceae bacterium]
ALTVLFGELFSLHSLFGESGTGCDGRKPSLRFLIQLQPWLERVGGSLKQRCTDTATLRWVVGGATCGRACAALLPVRSEERSPRHTSYRTPNHRKSATRQQSGPSKNFFSLAAIKRPDCCRRERIRATAKPGALVARHPEKRRLKKTSKPPELQAA